MNEDVSENVIGVMLMLEAEKISSIFIICILGAFLLGLIEPNYFIWLKPNIPVILGFIMFGVGLTLDGSDFKSVAHLKFKIILLIIIKYLTMPLFSYFVGILVKLPREELLGLVLVTACPGGMAAAVMSYLVRANVVLTILLTFVTTLLAPIITPLIMYLFFHKYVHIDVIKMFMTVLSVVIFPIGLGLCVRSILKDKIEFVKPYMPFVSIIAIGLLIGCISGLNRSLIFTVPLLLSLAIVITNLMGILFGYLIARFGFFGNNNYNNYAVGFEFGIQDSGLAVVLAFKFFSGAAALAGVLYSLCENLTGAILIRLLPKIRNRV